MYVFKQFGAKFESPYLNNVFRMKNSSNGDQSDPGKVWKF